MNEADYWIKLEYRVCSEFMGMRERRIQYLWCDGFIVHEYLLNDHRPRIVGRAWICNGPRQTEWEFTLLLSLPYTSLEEVDWESLLPPENMTRWLALDEARRCLEIEPIAAVPDRNVAETKPLSNAKQD